MSDQDANRHSQDFDDGNDPNTTQQRADRGARRSARDQQRGSQRNPPSTDRQFLFIDASTDRSTSGEAVRVHVMREAHRTRRERQGIQAQTRRRQTAAQDEIVIFDPRTPSQPQSASASASASAPATPPAPNITAPTDLVSTIDWPSLVRTGVSGSTSTSLETLHALAEGYLRSIRLLQPDILHLSRPDLLSMNAYLALATLQLTTSDQEPANIASAQFEARALELLRERITETTQMHADTTIVAVLLLSQLERKGNVESALFHWNALGRLVGDRGGMERLREDNLELYDVLVALGVEE